MTIAIVICYYLNTCLDAAPAAAAAAAANAAAITALAVTDVTSCTRRLGIKSRDREIDRQTDR